MDNNKVCPDSSDLQLIPLWSTSLIHLFSSCFFFLNYISNVQSRDSYSFLFRFLITFGQFTANSVCKIQAETNADVQPNPDSISDVCTNLQIFRQTSVLSLSKINSKEFNSKDLNYCVFIHKAHKILHYFYITANTFADCNQNVMVPTS